MSNWKNFVMFHKVLLKQNYASDPNFTFDHYNFIQANPDIPAEWDKAYFGDHIANEWDMPIYETRLQKDCYMAPSIIYHAYKNNLHKDLKYIGFLEYDIPLGQDDGSSTTQKIDNLLNEHERIIIPYRNQHTLKTLRGQKNIIMNGRNAIDQIFDDYNAFFNTNHKVKNFLNSPVATQQSFLCDTKTFEKIMKFIVHIIEDKYAERDKSWHRPSTLMDRYFAVSLLLEQEAITIPIALEHQSMKHWDDNVGINTATTSENYEKNGWDILRGVLTEEECEKALALLKVDGEKLSKEVGTEKSIRRIAIMYKKPHFKKVIQKIKDHGVISGLLGKFDDPIIDHMKPLIKAPGGGVETPWHQDGSFWSDFDPEKTMFTIWVALTPTTANSGAMKVLSTKETPESLPHIHVHNGNERVIDEPHLGQLLESGEIITCDLQPGDALIFKSDVIHSAFQNHSPDPRIAFKMVFQDAGKRPKDKPIGKFGFHLNGWLGKLNLNTPVHLFWTH